MCSVDYLCDHPRHLHEKGCILVNAYFTHVSKAVRGVYQGAQPRGRAAEQEAEAMLAGSRRLPALAHGL